MTAKAKPSKQEKAQTFIPYSEWSKETIKRITVLSDECLDRFNDDKKTNIEILKMLSKLQILIEKKYSE